MKRSAPSLAAYGCLAAAVLLIGGCAPASPASSPPVSAPSASGTATALDLTLPGVAEKVVADLLVASGSERVIMVEVRRHEASVSVLQGADKLPETWAYRGGEVKAVESDLSYVDQAVFDPSGFDLKDVGALFRAAAAVSGSDQQQELQIVDRQTVDHSPAEIMMAVSTVPETRTVFFYPDGRLLPTLDFTAHWGIERGLSDACGSHRAASAVGVGSALGAYVEYPGPDRTTVRRQRTAKFPVTVSVRNERSTGALFDPALVRPAVVTDVRDRLADRGRDTLTPEWSMVADDRDNAGTPRLRFAVGTERLVTDLAGREVKK